MYIYMYMYIHIHINGIDPLNDASVWGKKKKNVPGTKSTINGEDFYGPYDAQEKLRVGKAEIWGFLKACMDL